MVVIGPHPRKRADVVNLRPGDRQRLQRWRTVRGLGHHTPSLKRGDRLNSGIGARADPPPRERLKGAGGELVKLSAADNRPRHLTIANNALLSQFGPVVAGRHALDPDDRHAHQMADSSPCSSLGETLHPIDRHLLRVPRRAVADINDHVATRQRAVQPCAAHQIDAMLRRTAAQHARFSARVAQHRHDMPPYRTRSPYHSKNAHPRRRSPHHICDIASFTGSRPAVRRYLWPDDFKPLGPPARDSAASVQPPRIWSRF